MNDITKLDESTQAAISQFVKKFEVKSLEATKNSGISPEYEVTDLVLYCGKELDGKPAEYKVQFKLSEEYRDINQSLQKLESQPELSITLADKPEELASGMMDLTLRSFFRFITGRMIKAKQEEDIQSIPFVGNTFVLNRVTTFKVLSDDGEGRLAIEILKSDREQDLMLSAHGLMDGLYTGFIKEAFPRQQ
jgi:hypothetical protein